MGSFRALRVWLTTGALALLSLAFAVLVSPAASAGLRQETTVSAAPTAPAGTPAPLMLASTGLDITVPIIVGLGLLALGTVMVGWAFLATGRRGQRR
ncbi:MAG TPA: hypothetical protein VII33_16450 [Nakamurella sp.]|jgi:hypothetical protein